jgi:hypothetical protein
MTDPWRGAKPGGCACGKPIHGTDLPERAAPDSFRGVDLSTYLRMDPHLLLGLLNTELRNHCNSLDDLVKTHGLDARKLKDRMAKAGYEYQPAQNQFR